ncbi:MAG TPA: hypothetical protein IAC46_01545 [Candidatus Onthoplasma faecigallinarum]|nr:hypothetical protein [Candidatus Onthoplasma faecigallinarum]
MKKIISYLGFANKSNNIIVGQTHLRRFKGKIYLILVCSSASDNLINLAKNLAIKHSCEYIVTAPKLETLTNIKDVKIIGLTDENLSKAIINNKESINIG